MFALSDFYVFLRDLRSAVLLTGRGKGAESLWSLFLLNGPQRFYLFCIIGFKNSNQENQNKGSVDRLEHGLTQDM